MSQYTKTENEEKKYKDMPEKSARNNFVRSLYAVNGTAIRTARFKLVGEGEQVLYNYRSAVRIKPEKWIIRDHREVKSEKYAQSLDRVEFIDQLGYSDELVLYRNFLEAIEALSKYQFFRVEAKIEPYTEDDLSKILNNDRDLDFSYFRDFALREGIIFDQTAQQPRPTLNGSIIVPGNYLEKDIEAVKRYNAAYIINPPSGIVDLRLNSVIEAKTNDPNYDNDNNIPLHEQYFKIRSDRAAIDTFKNELKNCINILNLTFSFNEKLEQAITEESKIGGSQDKEGFFKSIKNQIFGDQKGDQALKENIKILHEKVGITTAEAGSFAYITKYCRPENVAHRNSPKAPIRQLETVYNDKLKETEYAAFGQNAIAELEQLYYIVGAKIYAEHYIGPDKDIGKEAKTTEIIKDVAEKYSKEGANEDQIEALYTVMLSEQTLGELYAFLIENQRDLMIRHGQILSDDQIEQVKRKAADKGQPEPENINQLRPQLKLGDHLLNTCEAIDQTLLKKREDIQNKINRRTKAGRQNSRLTI